MPHDARAVANFMIQKAREDGKWLTPLQVIKLVYFAQGWTLARTGKELFFQPVEAWKHGPAIRDVYREVKIYVDKPVENFLRSAPAKFDNNEEFLMSEVYRLYGGLGGVQMIQLTHNPDSPWCKTWEQSKTDHDIIDNELIKTFFESKDK